MRTRREVREGGTPSPALGTSALPGIRRILAFDPILPISAIIAAALALAVFATLIHVKSPGWSRPEPMMPWRKKSTGCAPKAGSTQWQLAKLAGTTASVICRLEDADYEGHSLAMLTRIAAALNRRVQIRFGSRRTCA